MDDFGPQLIWLAAVVGGVAFFVVGVARSRRTSVSGAFAAPPHAGHAAKTSASALKTGPRTRFPASVSGQKQPKREILILRR